MASPAANPLYNFDGGTLEATARELVASRLRQGHGVCFTITSSSMQPWLLPGTQVSVRAIDTALLRVGDVVVVQTGSGQWCTHRLIRHVACASTSCWVTKGDNAPHADVPIPPERIHGVVVAVREGSPVHGNPRWSSWRTPAMHWVGAVAAGLSRLEDTAVCYGAPLSGRVVSKCARLLIRLLHRLTTHQPL
jgi:signal peptidase I